MKKARTALINNLHSFCLLGVLIFGLMTIVACNGGNGGEDENGEPPDSEQISIFIKSPTYETAFTSDASPVTISGMGGGPIETITWENVTTGQSGIATGTESWSVQVPLQEGDNQIEITAISSEGGEEVTMPLMVTYNPSITFISLPQLTPDAGFTGLTYDSVYVRIAIDEINLDPTSVKVYRVDEFGDKAGVVGTLTDDGNIGNGDEIQADGIYSAKISLTSSTIDLIDMRIYASDIQGNESKTSIFSFIFIDELTDEELSQQDSDNTRVSDKLEELISEKMSGGLTEEEAAVQSLDELATYLEGLDGILGAGKGDFTVWWLNDNLFTFVIDVSEYYFEEDLLSGGESRENLHIIELDGAGADLEKLDARHTQLEYLKTKPTPSEGIIQTLAAGDVEDQFKVGSLDVIHISPFKDVSERWKASTAWENVLKDNECLHNKIPKINTVTDPIMHEFSNNLPDIFNAWKSLNKYGLISIITHGNNVPGLKQKIIQKAKEWATTKGQKKYPGKSHEWLIKYYRKRVTLIHTWNQDAREYFRTNIGIDGSEEAWKSYRSDAKFQFLRRAIRQNRIILLLKKNKPKNEHYYEILITPEFIAKFNVGDFPKSIWFATACRSASTYSMANVFRAKGGLAYIGFSNLVDQAYGVNTQRSFFDALVNKDMNVGEALDAIRSDPNLGPDDGKARPGRGGAAKIRGKGKREAKVVFELKNPSFEDPDKKGSLEGWGIEGDARDMKKLGNASPTHGNTMAIISSGFVTTSYGKLSQSVCLSKNVKDLIFDWNFFSEEFKEYCNQGFNDTFLVTITDKETGQETVLFNTSVDIICNGCYGYDLESEACQNLPIKPASVSFDQGEVWYTDWKKDETVDLRSFKSKAVILKFYIEDKGDEVYTTAVLIDNVRITTLQ